MKHKIRNLQVGYRAMCCVTFSHCRGQLCMSLRGTVCCQFFCNRQNATAGSALRIIFIAVPSPWLTRRGRSLLSFSLVPRKCRTETGKTRHVSKRCMVGNVVNCFPNHVHVLTSEIYTAKHLYADATWEKCPASP